jgi:SET domain-containing protein
VYAVGPIAAGERVVEYTGERISDEEAARRHPADPADPHHTFYFSLEGGGVIDARHKGNSARWINHACAPSGPNCEAAEVKGRVFIHALRDIEPGEELFYDYHLTIDERLTPKLKRDYACRCGAASCRGTLLQPKRR